MISAVDLAFIDDQKNTNK